VDTVAAYGWTSTDVLEAACHKAGLARSAWRWSDTRIELFEIQRIAGPVHA
jgi:AMMECR1 domain-containing protein